MTYELFEEICSNNKICIWGCGKYGQTYAYWSLKSADAEIACYCDSNYVEGREYHGIPQIRKEELFLLQDIFVFVAIKNIGAQEKVLDELRKHNLQAHVFDLQTFSTLCSSLEKCRDANVTCKYQSLISDEAYLSMIFEEKLGHKLNLASPKTFNEKLQWLKIHNRNPYYNKLVDKAEVKNVVARIIGQEYVIPTLGTWMRFEDIDFEKLPEQYVLKCTHDSGSIAICSDRDNFDIQGAKKKLTKALDTNYYWLGREWPYKDIKPRILAEEYICSTKYDVLPVYKFFCFEGEPKLIQAIKNDKTDKETIDYYDISWNRLDIRQNYPNSDVPLERPEQLEKMTELARLLSEGVPFIRVDFYAFDSKVLFSEFTFFSDCGLEKFYPESVDLRLGDLINI